MNPNIATLDEAAQVLSREIGNDEATVSCRTHLLNGTHAPRMWEISFYGEWVPGKIVYFTKLSLTDCVHAALVWYRANRKAVTA